MNSVIIFGGSQGIGRNIATYFIENNYSVSVASRNNNNLDDLNSEIEKKGLKVNTIKSDIGNIDEVRKAFENHKKTFGNFPSYIINTAGAQGPIGLSWQISDSELKETIRINLLGCFYITKISIECLIKKKHFGSIILFSGGGSCYSRPNFCAYGVSKTGVLRLVETIADELIINGHQDIIINAIAPGAVKTKMTEEVLKSKELAGEKAYKEAEEVFKSGGTNRSEILKLIDFLCNPLLNKGLSGRLIHVKDNYLEFAEQYKKNEEAGKLRRIAIS